MKTKERLRHPINSIREPFGTAGLIVAMIALIAALGGTALAAKGALTGKQKKEVEKIAKKFAGKPGAPGANGTNGLPGAKGDTGAPGANGSNGTNGTDGAPGAPGASVTGAPIAAGGECGAGVAGVKYTLSGTSTKICNGKEGEPGAIHPGETLPSEASETGVWSFDETAKDGHSSNVAVPISFPIPLAAGIAEADVHVFEGETAPTGCVLSSGYLEAEPGVLCVQIREIGLPKPIKASELLPIDLESVEGGSGRTGAMLFGEFLPEGVAGAGTWAVTAP